MSMAIGHFSAGASATFVLFHLLPPRARRKVGQYGFIAILAGLWAMVPDLSKFTARLQSLHDSIWANLFFFHQLMDMVDAHDSIWVSSALVGLMIVLMFTLWASDIWQHRAG